MGPSIDAGLLSRWMLHKQRLHPRSSQDGILPVVDDIVALHATDSLSPYLSLLARLPGFEKQSLDGLLEKEKRLGKVRFVRKTVHVLTLPMLPVAFAAVKSLLIPRAEVWLAYLGLSSREYAHMSRRIAGLLAGGGMTAKEVKAELGGEAPVSAVLIYEGFDMGGAAGALAGKAVSGSGLTGNWGATASITYDPTGLTFGSLMVTGGTATTAYAINTSGNASASFGAAPSGTWYGSYLAQWNEGHGHFGIANALGDYHFRANAHDLEKKTCDAKTREANYSSGAWTPTPSHASRVQK